MAVSGIEVALSVLFSFVFFSEKYNYEMNALCQMRL